MKFIFIIFYTSYYLTCVTSKSDFEWRFENNTCTISEPSIISLLRCGLSKNVKRRTMYMEYKFAQDITQWYLNFKTILPRKTKDFVLLNLTNTDGCQLLGNKHQVNLLQLARSTLDRYSNVPLSCPYLKDKSYYIRGLRFAMESLPAFGFETDVNIFYEFIVQKKIVFSGYLRSHVGLKNSKKGKN